MTSANDLAKEQFYVCTPSKLHANLRVSEKNIHHCYQQRYIHYIYVRCCTLEVEKRPGTWLEAAANGSSNVERQSRIWSTRLSLLTIFKEKRRKKSDILKNGKGEEATALDILPKHQFWLK